MKTDEEIRIGVDALQGDLANHQRIAGREVTGEANRTLVVDTYTELARKWSDEKPTTDATEPPREAETGTSTVDVDGRTYTVDKADTDDLAFRKATETEAFQLQRLWARVELLMTKRDEGPLGQPSYYTRLMAITAVMARACALARAGMMADAEALERRFRAELVALCEESNRHFGDWKADRVLVVS